jgi:DNA polymerase I-like protein with 3'-5' exonuclease and polymerase domains
MPVVKKIALVDYGDTRISNKALEIVEAVFEETGWTDEVLYYHLDKRTQLLELKGHDLIVSMGAEALEPLCNTSRPLKKYAGSLTYNPGLRTWVLPTQHPNCIYQGKYNLFDDIYDHLRRAVSLCRGTLSFPPVGGHKLDWEMVGHNGRRGTYPGDAKVFDGYFDATRDEVDRQAEVLGDWLTRLDSGEKCTFGADTESFTTDHFRPLTMIQIYDPGMRKAFAFNWGVIEWAKDLWVRFFQHPNATFIWHNIKHDAKMIYHWLGFWPLGENHDDTLAWALGLTEKGNQTGLKYLSRQYCGAPYYEEGLDEWLDKSDINYGHIRPDVLAEYGCLDVFYTYQLSGVLPQLVDAEGTTSLVRNILLPAQRTFAQVEYAGIRIDQEYAQSLAADWTPLINEAIQQVQEYAKEVGFPADPEMTAGQIERRICPCVPVSLWGELSGLSVAGYRKYLRETHGLDDACTKCNKRRYLRVVDNTLNVHSTKQMHHLCFDMLGMEQTWEGRKTNKYFWEINQNHEFAQLVKSYRELDYLNRNIVQGFGRFVREDGRVHPSIALWGTVTGRLAVRDPAMQTVPKHSANAKHIRRMFLPDPGDLVVDIDYSNLEMYMAAHLTGDQNLVKALDQDIHRTTAAAMYMKAYEEVLAEERQSAKPVNFGAGYNIKAKKLSRDKNLVKITEGEASKAQEFLDAFWNEYWQWDIARKEWIEEATQNCELRTELGRKRRWSLITKDNLWKVENQACNFKGQSLASDLCLTSLIALHSLLTAKEWGRVMISVHDSIVFSIHPENIHEAIPFIKKIMTTPMFETDIQFKVDVTVGPNYGDQESYDPEKDYVKAA